MFKKRIALFIVLLLFIACKIPQLHYAYYWDECKPYAVAISNMYHHGPSLMPGAIDPEVSRGHPLFFHAAAAMWMDIFGDSHVSVHSFALLVSVLLLIAIYEAGLRLFNERAAILALLLMSVQEMFFVQSSMALPEVLVALLCFLSLVFYVKEKYVLTALSLTLLFYTKESGMVIGVVLGLEALMGMFSSASERKQKISALLATGIPVVLIAIFFIVQKQKLGWYLFPDHVNMMNNNWGSFWYSLRMNVIATEFTTNNRFWYFLILISIAVVAAIKQKRIALLAILLPAVCMYYFVDDTRAGRLLPPIPFFIVFILSVVCFLYFYSLEKYFTNSHQRRLIILSGLFVLCYLCFCAMNFFTPRYSLASMVPLFFINAIFCDMVIGEAYKWMFYLVVVAILFISTIAFNTNESIGDCDHGSYRALDVQQDVVDYFEKNVAPDKMIGTGSILEYVHLHEPETGFLQGKDGFKNIRWDIDEKTSYAVFDNIESDPRYNTVSKDTSFRLVRRFDRGNVWAEIYQRK